MGVNNLYIVDTSVALKWVLRESESDVEQALLLRQRFFEDELRLMVPDHFFVEFLNICLRKIPNEALLAFSHLENAQIPFVHVSTELAFRGSLLMKKHPSISFYDAFYHALAMEKGGTFVTADEKYYKSTQKEGHVLLLKDYH